MSASGPPDLSFRYDDSGIHETYDAARQLSPEARELWSRALAGPLGRASTTFVVEVGCGTGRFLSLVRALSRAAICGIDVSEAMLGVAARRAIPRAHLVRASAEALPLRDGVAHVALLLFVYHHVGDKPAALRELARVLGPGGRLVVGAPTRENLDSYPWMRFFPRARSLDWERMPARSSVIETGRQAGLALEHLSTMEQPTAPSWPAYAKRIAMRGISTLRLLSDREFETGLAALTRCSAARDPSDPVNEELDLFVFRR